MMMRLSLVVLSLACASSLFLADDKPASIAKGTRSRFVPHPQALVQSQTTAKADDASEPQAQQQAASAPASAPAKVELFHGETAIDTSKVANMAVSAPQTGFTVDFVLSWMDLSSPTLRRDLEAVGSKDRIDAASIDQYEWLGEVGLRYSLRSFLEHAPFVRKIHLVTSDTQQLPAWLDTHSSKLNIVTHSEFFERPERDLPTFNPLAIEANIHRVPGLAEHFVYFKSGSFLVSKISREDLFTKDGKAIQYYQDRHDSYPGLPELFQKVQSASFMAVDKYLAGTDTHDVHASVISSLKFLPQIRPLLRSDLEKASEAFSEELALTSHHRAALPTDLSLADLSRDISFSEEKSILDHWNQFEVIFTSTSKPIAEFEGSFAEARATRPKLLAIDTWMASAEANQQLREKIRVNLDSLLPLPSVAEKDGML